MQMHDQIVAAMDDDDAAVVDVAVPPTGPFTIVVLIICLFMCVVLIIGPFIVVVLIICQSMFVVLN